MFSAIRCPTCHWAKAASAVHLQIGVSGSVDPQANCEAREVTSPVSHRIRQTWKVLALMTAVIHSLRSSCRDFICAQRCIIWNAASLHSSALPTSTLASMTDSRHANAANDLHRQMSGWGCPAVRLNFSMHLLVSVIILLDGIAETCCCRTAAN